MNTAARRLWGIFCLTLWVVLCALGPVDSRAQQEGAVLSAAEVDSVNAARAARIQLMYDGYRRDFPEIGEVDAISLQQWLEEENLVLVDVRRDEEREVSVVEGSISRQEYEGRRAEYADKRVVTYCTIGYRSGRYADILRKNGIESYNLVGGILAWVHASGTVDLDGKPTQRVHVYGQQWSLLPVGFEPVW